MNLLKEINIFFRLFILCLLSLIITIFIPERNIYSQDRAPIKGDDICISSKCHATMGKDTFVHMPVADGDCNVCHGESPGHGDNPDKYRFGEIKAPGDICFECHDRLKTRKFIHEPVQEGECTACHSPHGSPYKSLLVESGSNLCFMCHDDEIISGKFIHGPADAGGCKACHDPHSADYEKNLKFKGPDLCFLCHSDMGAEFREAKVIHKPVAEKCTNCHNPHSAQEQFMLDDISPTLCFKCHKEKKEEVANAAVQHGALMTGKACLNCHEPHVSNLAKRLSLAPLDLCLSCHDKQVKTPDGRLLTNMKKLLMENKDHHGPIKQKDCSGCHNPHGSDEFRILREKYPSSFYMPYKTGNYDLCFKCHEKTIVQDPETSLLTEFRNGNINLHFKHINNRIKGRTCRACHETHASNYPKHIRMSVPFGNWNFDMNYMKTETGGSCAPGCHKIRKYDRARKVDN